MVVGGEGDIPPTDTKLKYDYNGTSVLPEIEFVLCIMLALTTHCIHTVQSFIILCLGGGRAPAGSLSIDNKAVLLVLDTS